MKKSFCFLVAAMCGMIVNTAHAGVVWSFTTIVNTGGAQANMGTGFLDASGTLLLAENLGGVATTIDGISFAAGSYSLGGTSGNAFHASDPILDSGTFGTNGNGSNATGVDVSIGNDSSTATATDIPVTLTPGSTYRIQLVVADGRGTATARSIEFDGQAADHATGVSGSSWGNSLLATGTFVADSTGFKNFNSQLFQGDARNDTQFNAIVIQEIPAAIPEPSSLVVLSAFGCLGLLKRRR